MIKKLLIILFVIGVTISMALKTTAPSLASNICGGCGACDDNVSCCCGSSSVNCGCIQCGTSCPGSSSSSGGCTNTRTCLSASTAEYTYFSSSGAGDWGVLILPTNVSTKAIHQKPSGDTCNPKWPTWSENGGQDDLVWHTKSGQNSVNDIYSLIPFSGSNHPIAWNNTTQIVHTYINSNATMCGGIALYECYGAFSVASGTYAKSSGTSYYTTMSVTGTSIYNQTGGEVFVGKCN